MAVKVLSSEIKTLERFPIHPIVAESLDFVFTAPTAFSDGIQFPITGRELILIQNTDAGAQTFSIASVRDVHGRLGDITTYSVGIGEFAYVPVGAKELFGAAGGTMVVTMSANTVKVAVLRLPNLV